MLAGFDPLHDEGMQYVEKLRDAGVKVELKDYSDMVHDFIYLQAIVPQAQALQSAIQSTADSVSCGLSSG